MDPRECATAQALKDLDGFQTFRKTGLTRARQMTSPFTVDTLEGTMSAPAGDYLCLDIKGNPYPCAADVFEASYEAVSKGVAS